MTPSDRPSDDALWASVATVLREVVLPAIDDEWARAATTQLIGLAAYARRRGEDPTSGRLDELRVALDELAGNELLVANAGDDVLATCSAVLAASVGRDDVAAAEARARLRPLLVRHLDEDLAGNGMLMGSFVGQVVDA